MAADQAAGLRRRSAQRAVHCVQCFFEHPAQMLRLAGARHPAGQTLLVVDTCDRLFADATTRSLFDWPQQLAQGRINTLPYTWGRGWSAPRLALDAPGLLMAWASYDSVMIDSGPVTQQHVWARGPARAVLLEVDPAPASMHHAFRLLKTMSHAGNTLGIGLLGDVATCDHVRAACGQFLEPSFVSSVYSVAHEHDAFAELAVRMADEETPHTKRCK